MTALETRIQGMDSLLSFAMLASGAEGYALAEFDQNRDLITRHAGGEALQFPKHLRATGGVTIHNGTAFVSYPLGQSALIAFVVPKAGVDSAKLAVLDRLAAAIERLYEVPETVLRTAAKIALLDAELAGLKIAERARGLMQKNRLDDADVETVIRQVEQVVGSRQTETDLSRLLGFLEDHLEERKLLIAAKELLERTQGLTEEEAYIFLRQKSRVNRRRLRVVAQELLEGGG